jgi:hypothetical protein
LTDQSLDVIFESPKAGLASNYARVSSEVFMGTGQRIRVRVLGVKEGKALAVPLGEERMKRVAS